MLDEDGILPREHVSHAARCTIRTPFPVLMHQRSAAILYIKPITVEAFDGYGLASFVSGPFVLFRGCATGKEKGGAEEPDASHERKLHPL